MTGLLGFVARTVALATTGLGGVVEAQAVDVQLATGPVMAFDIAGVRLGMTAADARSTLARSGYAVAPQQSYSYVHSFQQNVRSEADSRLGRASRVPESASVSELDALGPHQERIHVSMVQMPAGPIVSEVTFHVPQESMTRDAFKAQVLAKYGPPRRVVAGDEGKWCSPEAASFCGMLLPNAGHYDTDYPTLTTSLLGRSLDLSIGADQGKRLDRAQETAVQALAPKTARAAF